MEPLEVDVDKNRVVSFDGRVLEVFGGPGRFHVHLLTIAVAGPDKHGSRNVTLRQAGEVLFLPLDALAFERIQPLLDALKQAGVSIVG